MRHNYRIYKYTTTDNKITYRIKKRVLWIFWQYLKYSAIDYYVDSKYVYTLIREFESVKQAIDTIHTLHKPNIKPKPTIELIQEYAIEH